jgi:hypothetical protein
MEKYGQGGFSFAPDDRQLGEARAVILTTRTRRFIPTAVRAKLKQKAIGHGRRGSAAAAQHDRWQTGLGLS